MLFTGFLTGAGYSPLKKLTLVQGMLLLDQLVFTPERPNSKNRS